MGSVNDSKPLVLLTGMLASDSFLHLKHLTDNLPSIGPNGFVGSHVLQQLLASGYRVRGTVRSLSKSSYLANLYPNETASGDLHFVTVPDIEAPGALDSAILGSDSSSNSSTTLESEPASYVCHVASPYFTASKSPLEELINPAVNGTRNVLTSALRSTQLKRLTVLSSFASVVDLSLNPRAGYSYTEKDWNPVTLEEGSKDGYWGYHASKTFAESAASEMFHNAKPAPSWGLVTFCPPMIYGPPIHEIDASKGIDGLGTSLRRLLSSITGTDPNYPGKVPPFGLPAFVDVRDVALAHIRALQLPDGTAERFLLCGGMASFEDGLGEMREKGVKGLAEEKGENFNAAEHFNIDAAKARKLARHQLP